MNTNPGGAPLTDISVDDLSQDNAIGSLSNAMTNNVFGFNHLQTPSAIPMNKDHFGFTFFTRPQLNMRTQNLRNNRLFNPLLTNASRSYQRAIRCMLDPRIMEHYDDDETGLKCEIFDNKQAFFPILTNHLDTISGWPDITIPSFTSKAGIYREEYSMVDGVALPYNTYDLTATFRNSRGSPILNLFYYWSIYQSLVFEGRLMPYPDMIVRKEIDYNTRIYRLVLDQSKRFVQNISAIGAGFPLAVPIGGTFDYSNEKPYNDANAQISIPIRCMGAIYNDSILIDAFNKTAIAFNRELKDTKRSSTHVKIPYQLQEIFNHRGYPYINTETYELEWWVPNDVYSAVIAGYKDFLNEMNLEP